MTLTRSAPGSTVTGAGGEPRGQEVGKQGRPARRSSAPPPEGTPQAPTGVLSEAPPAGASDPSGPGAEADDRHVPRWRALAELPLLAALAVVIVVVVRLLLVQAFYIPSGSMLPQLQLQDKVVVSRLAYRFHSPHRGDIVVFNAPPNAQLESVPPHGGSALRRFGRYIGQRLGLTASSDVFIKRVIGLPGDTVAGYQGHVYINGQLLLEPYLPPGVETASFGPVKVPPGKLWVMGDNRTNSSDSRVFGPIRESTVIGRAMVRVWPLSHLAFL